MAREIRPQLGAGVTLHAAVGDSRVDLTLDHIRALAKALPSGAPGHPAELKALFGEGVLQLALVPPPTPAEIDEVLIGDGAWRLDPRTELELRLSHSSEWLPLQGSAPFTWFIPPDVAKALAALAHQLRTAGKLMHYNSAARGRILPEADLLRAFGGICRKACAVKPLSDYLEVRDDHESGYRMALRQPLQAETCPYGQAILIVKPLAGAPAGSHAEEFPSAALPEVAALVRALRGGLTPAELRERLDRSAHPGALLRVLGAIRRCGANAGREVEAPDWDALLPPDLPLGALHLGHAGLLVRGGNDVALFDPWFLPSRDRHERQPLLARQLPPVGAICLTHEHWDHVDAEIVLHYPPDVPVIVPKSDGRAALTPRYRDYLGMLGCREVIELGHWESHVLPGGMVLTAVPFTGEGTSEDHVVRNCYLVTRGSKRLFVHVDSSTDAAGKSDLTDGTIDRLIAEHGPIDVTYATRRQELHLGLEVISDLVPVFYGEDPRRFAGVVDNCYCPPDYIAELVRATQSALLVLYSEGGHDWFPEDTNFLRPDVEENFLCADYGWEPLEAFEAACPVPLHMSAPLDAVWIGDEVEIRRG